MALEISTLEREIEKGLESLSEQRGAEFAAKIRLILYANTERQRLQKFLEGDVSIIHEYIVRVIEKYDRLHPYIHQLQIEKSDRVWSLLLKDMQKWAYRFLIRKGYNTNVDTWENALECASEAAKNVLNAHFPYDTEFEPWARVVVQNACLKFIRRKAKDVPVYEESLDELESTMWSAKSLLVHNENFDKGGEQSWLLDALTELPDLRRQVIEMKYFQDLTPNEIAEKLGKSVRAIYSLQFHALQDLRKILDQNRNKFNE